MTAYLRSRYIFIAALITAVLCIVAGVLLNEHAMIFTYGVVVCLNCMGIG